MLPTQCSRYTPISTPWWDWEAIFTLWRPIYRKLRSLRYIVICARIRAIWDESESICLQTIIPALQSRKAVLYISIIPQTKGNIIWFYFLAQTMTGLNSGKYWQAVVGSELSETLPQRGPNVCRRWPSVPWCLSRSCWRSRMGWELFL